MDLDYPAAHSMDACWFAVDRDGHVGVFDTGESGAMPTVGVHGEEAFALRERLTGLVEAGDALYDPRGQLLQGSVPIPLPDGLGALIFLRTLAPVQSDIEAGRATVVRATEGYAVVISRLTAEQARRINDSGQMVGWTYSFHGEHAPVILAQHGVYEFTHLHENWIAGPYGRERVPARRLHIDQLPPDLRRRLKETQLSKLSFADLEQIQPMEHWPCESWEPAWLGTDGVVRPIPDRGDEYEDIYDSFRTEFPQYRFEPPPTDHD